MTVAGMVRDAMASGAAPAPTTGAGTFCGNCGGKLPDGAKFCPACGAKRA
jgi:predicted amidophosphoribosyltransferase